MMLEFRSLVSGCVALVASVMAFPGGAIEAIGDPWWDEAVAGPAEVMPAGEGGAPVVQARERIRMQQREAALRLLGRELSLVRAACPSLAVDQRAAIVAVGRKAVEDALKADGKVAQPPQAVAPGVVVRVQIQGGSPRGDVERGIRDALAKAVAELAPSDEAQAYRRELAARAERRRAAAMAVIVDAVDQTAMLDDAIRAKLEAALKKKWQPFWEQAATQSGQVRMTGSRLPPGVAAVVAEVLGPDEFTKWQERLRRVPAS